MSGITSEDRKEITGMIADHLEPINRQMGKLLELTQKAFDLQRQSSDNLKDFQADMRVEKANEKNRIDNIDKRLICVEEITNLLPTPKRRQADQERKMNSVQYIMVATAVVGGLAVIWGGGSWLWSQFMTHVDRVIIEKQNAVLKESPIKPQRQEAKK